MSTPHDLFRRLTTGVYVVTASDGAASGAFTAAWVTQVAFEPLLVAISVNPGNATWPIIERSRRFTINVLKAGQLELARRFGTSSSRDEDKLSSVATVAGDGFIRLSDGAAWLDCRVEQVVRTGDHVVLISRVMGGDVLDAAAVPMQYADTGNMDGSAALYPPAFP